MELSHMTSQCTWGLGGVRGEQQSEAGGWERSLGLPPEVSITLVISSH